MSIRLTTPLLSLAALAAFSLCAAQSPSVRLVDPSVQARTGFDSNPIASGPSSAAVLGDKDSLVYSIGAGFGVAFAPTPSAPAALTLNYAGEWQHFDRLASENFSTQRLSFTGTHKVAAWKFSGDGSLLFIDGRNRNLGVVSATNANGLALWRDRRDQRQDRLKLQTLADFDPLLLRATGTWLNNDYGVRAVSTEFFSADRADLQGALELGWKQNSTSTWFAGLRAGHQRQEVVPLPNCEFEYSNRYHRFTAAWEGSPFAGTTVTLAAGPDFRRYTGAVDPRVFVGGRDRTSLWFEGSFSSKVSPSVTLTGKAARMDWLASTAKSAYIDSAAELALNWTLSPVWTARLTTKVHRCDYFPAVRDDWESLVGTGASWKCSAKTTLTIDLLRHRGWNGLANATGRDFHRTVVAVGAVIKL